MRTSSLTILALLTAAGHVRAQAVLLPKDDTLKGATDKDIQGWNPSLSGTATVNIVSNSSVVGQVDGLSTLFGIGVVGGLDFAKDKHLLRTTLGISESFARTPVVDDFVKTTDSVQLEGLYNYFASDTLGGFGRLSLQTSLFPTTDVRGLPTSWVEKLAAGGSTPLTANAFNQRLAGSFAPFTINESIGGFAEPMHSEPLNLSVRGGVGGRHTFADSVLLSNDDKATNEIELIRLANVHQLGLEAFAGANGKLREGKLTYRAGLSVLVPVVNNDKFNRGVGTLTRIGLEGAVTFNVYEWMSLVYSLAITRDAQLFPQGNELTQIQNSLLLTFNYTLVKRKDKPAEPSDAERELAALRTRADAADQARAAAEDLAKDLRRQLETCTARPCAPAPAAPAP
jgi:hypothetical protein